MRREETEEGYVPEGVEESLESPTKEDRGGDCEGQLLAMRRIDVFGAAKGQSLGLAPLDEGPSPLHLGRNKDISGPANTSTQAQQTTLQTMVITRGNGRIGGSLDEVVVNRLLEIMPPLSERELEERRSASNSLNPALDLSLALAFQEKLNDPRITSILKRRAAHGELELINIKIIWSTIILETNNKLINIRRYYFFMNK
ncbi:hypothetical protein F511_45008 [Dorcoceras hygrometricum]|uniref:Uncharacterized protein n=1 Tax=Dorcoceras hygrometricum TaxID=472368 RepID=A0A2Z6ZX33_9LAMI|nr:hypothetical protein F511_45008 [Dorcoceras hygrometricum]